MTTTWHATHYDGLTAQPRPVALTLTPEGLTFPSADGTDTVWPYAALRPVQGRWPGQPVRLQHGREALVVANPAVLLALAAAAPRSRVKPALGRRALALRAVGALAGIALASTTYFQWLNPNLARLAAPHVPIAWEEKLGQAVVDRLAPVDQRCTNPERLAQVQRVVDTLTAAQPSPYTYKVTILNSDEVNAFAAPGGFIVVNEALLKATKTPEELAGILAHEIQHIHRRHVTRHLLESIGLQAIASVLFADTSMSTLAWALGFVRYGQALETEADHAGMALMQKARLDPQAMVTAFRDDLPGDEEEDAGWWDWLSTHPRMDDRVRALEAQAKEVAYAPRSISLEWHWMHVSGGCDAIPYEEASAAEDAN